MKILNCFMILIILLLLALMYGIHRDIQFLKEQMINIEADSGEIDNASDCLVFPCYTAKHRQWVSQKYLTKGAM